MATLGFEMEWYDTMAGLRVMFLKFFLDDNTIEILQSQSTFLKRIYYPEITLNDLFIGNSITIHNRVYVIKKYVNAATISFMASREVRYMCILKKGALFEASTLLQIAKKNGLVLGRSYTFGSPIDIEGNYVSEGDGMIEIVGISGGTNLNFGDAVDKLGLNAIVIQTNADAVNDLVKSATLSYTTTDPVTLCIIKPHVIKSQKTDELMQTIQKDGRFQLSGLFTTHITLPMAEELFDVYRGIYLNYMDIMEHLTSTPILVLMISSDRLNQNELVKSFREFCGPFNPQLAKVLRPQSLRALYGSSIIKNAVHCTDLSDDGPLECKYFFETISSL